MAGLAQHKVVGALPPIIDHLTDKDPMVAAAAATALTDYASPPVHPQVQGHLIDGLLGVLESGPDTAKVKLVDIFRRLGPGRSPLKERLEAFAEKAGLSLATKSVLARLIQPPAPAATAPDAAGGESGRCGAGRRDRGGGTGRGCGFKGGGRTDRARQEARLHACAAAVDQGWQARPRADAAGVSAWPR